MNTVTDPWHQVFCGRKDDLNVLKNAWQELRADAASFQIITIVAESGLGKTRLIQEFYNWLSTTVDGIEGAGYWPDVLTVDGNNLAINPKPEDCRAENNMPYLWWGIRVPNQLGRNVGRGGVTADVDLLHPHVESYARAQLLREKAIDLMKGAAQDIAIEVANTFTLNLVGLAKTGFQRGAELADLLKESKRPKVTLQDSREHYQQSISDLIIDDLGSVFDRRKEQGVFIPAVIVVDDAHWLNGDAMTMEFVERLIRTAQNRDWPILVLATHWEREWHLGWEAGTPCFARLCRNLLPASWRPMFLKKEPDLGDMVSSVFQGLPDRQHRLLLEKADGNPLLMEELLRHLRRKPRFFAGRDTDGALSEAGEVEVAEKTFNIHDLIFERLSDAPEVVRVALGLSSLQGVRYLEPISVLTGAMLEQAGVGEGLALAQRPHAFVERVEDKIAEFGQRLYWEVAEEQLADLFDDTDLLRAKLRRGFVEFAGKDAACSEYGQAMRESAWMLGTVLLSEDEASAEEKRLAAWCFARAAEAFSEKYAYAELTALSARFEEALREHRADPSAVPFRSMVPIAQGALNGGDMARARSLFEYLVEHCRQLVTDHGAADDREDLAAALNGLSLAIGRLDGARAAKPYQEECLALSRELAEERGTASALRDLSIVLSLYAYILLESSSLADASAYCEEAERVARQAVAAAKGYEAHDCLQTAVSLLGDIVFDLQGPHAAIKIYEENVSLAIKISQVNATPLNRQNLSSALSKLGQAISKAGDPFGADQYLEESEKIIQELFDTVGGYDEVFAWITFLKWKGLRYSELYGPAKARPFFEEGLALAHDLAKETGSRDAKSELSDAHYYLANALMEMEGVDAALPHYLESEKITRALFEEQAGIGEQTSLASSIGALSIVEDVVNGPAAALPLLKEEVEIFRALAIAHDLPVYRRNLAAALSRLVEVTLALEGAEAARPVAQEGLEIVHSVAAQLGTPQSRIEEVSALQQLGNIVQDIEGPRNGLLYFEEAERLARNLMETYPMPDAYDALQSTLAYLGNAIYQINGPGAAIEYFRDELEMCRTRSATLNTPNARRNYSSALTRMGRAIQDLKGAEKARQYWEEDLSISRELADRLGTLSAKQDLALSLSNFAGMLEQTEGPGAGIACYEDAIALIRELLVGRMDRQLRMDLALALYAVSNAKFDAGKPEDALTEAQEALALAQALRDNAGTLDDRLNYQMMLTHVGNLVLDLAGCEVARPYYEKCLAESVALSEEFDLPVVWQHLKVAFWNLGEAVAELEGADAAAPYFAESEKYADKTDHVPDA